MRCRSWPAAVLLCRVADPPGRPDGFRAKRGAGASGLRMLWHDQVLRVLALCIFVMNVTLTGTLAVLVIYAHDRLHVGPTGYGLLSASIASAVAGTALIGRLQRRFGTSTLLEAGLVIEMGTQLTLALTSTWAVAAIALLIFGVTPVRCGRC